MKALFQVSILSQKCLPGYSASYQYACTHSNLKAGLALVVYLNNQQVVASPPSHPCCRLLHIRSLAKASILVLIKIISISPYLQSGGCDHGLCCFSLVWSSYIPILKHIILYSCTIINIEPFTEIGFALKFRVIWCSFRYHSINYMRLNDSTKYPIFHLRPI